MNNASLHPIATTGWQASALSISTDRPTTNCLFIGLLQHRHFDTVTFRGFDGNLIARVGVSDYAHAWIRCQDSFQPPGCFRSSIRHDDLSCVL